MKRLQHMHMHINVVDHVLQSPFISTITHILRISHHASPISNCFFGFLCMQNENKNKNNHAKLYVIIAVTSVRATCIAWCSVQHALAAISIGIVRREGIKSNCPN